MIYPNSPQLQKWLAKDHPDLAKRSAFPINRNHFDQHRKELVEQADTPEEQLDDLAVFVSLTHDDHQDARVLVETPVRAIPESNTELLKEARRLRRWLIAIAVLLMIFGLASIARSQNLNPAIVVPTCGTAPSPYPASGGRAPLIVDVNGNLCSGVSVSATVNTAGLAISVNAGSDSTVGAPIYGRVTTAAPSYTTNTYNALSLDPTGNLRVAGSFSAGAPADTVGTTVSLNSASGAGSHADVATAGQQGVTVHFASGGTLVGTVVAEVSFDGGTTWNPAVFTNYNTQNSISAFTSLANPTADVSISYAGPITNARVRVSAYTSGSTDVTLRAVATEGFRATYGWNSTTGTYQAITVGNSGRAWTEIRDAAGNTRGVNVNASNQLSVSVDNSPTVTANAGTNLNTSLLALESGGNLATLAGVVTSSRAAVNPISGQAGVQGGSGTVSALTQRVVLATDVGLPTGANTIGIVNQGTPASGPNAWPHTLTDTSDTIVKPGDAANNAIRVNVVAGAAGGGTSSNFAAAFPATGTAAGFKDANGNMGAATVTLDGQEYVRVASLDPTILGSLTRAMANAPLKLKANLGNVTTTGNALDVNIKYPEPVLDPCQGPKGFVAISQALSAQVITANPGMTANICGLFVTGSDAENLSLVYGTGTVCATGTTAMIGGTTAALGPNMAANGGWVQGFANSSIAKAPYGQNVCLIQSGTGRVAGNLVVAFSP